MKDQKSRACARRGLTNSIVFLTAAIVPLLAACHKQAAEKPRPPEVLVRTLTPTNVAVFDEWIGTLDGSVNAQIRAQVTGYLQSQKYAEGSHVKKGDVLFEIDARPFQAALDQAEARLAQDRAQLVKTELDVKRIKPLADEKAMSQQELDNAVQANLAQEAQVKADEAAVELARVNMGFTKITAPIDGIAGLATAQIGDLVQPSGSALTTVSTLDPIKVYFQVSESSYLSFWRKFTGGNESVAAPELRLVLTDGSVYPSAGKFFFADRQVNPNTSTLQIFGLFPNPENLLRPGQYGRVRVQTSVKRDVFVLPQRAINEIQGSYQVAVVDDQKVAHLKNVTVGDRVGSNWLVETGLKAADQVVIEGVQKVKEGTVVEPKPFGEAGAQDRALSSAR